MISRRLIFVIIAAAAATSLYYVARASGRPSETRTALVAAANQSSSKSVPRKLSPIPASVPDDDGPFEPNYVANQSSSEESSSSSPVAKSGSNLVPGIARREESPPTPVPTVSPLIDSLRTLQDAQSSSAASDRLFGASGNNGLGGSNTPLDAVPTTTPIVSPTATPGVARVGGQATGYDMLYLMQPQARATVEKQIEILLDAQVNDLYLGALVDGTFSIDFPYLRDVVQRLNGDGRTLTLVLYFSNGSAMRNQTPPPTALNVIAPDLFRFLIENDSRTQLEFQSLVSAANSTFDLNTSLSPANHNVAIVMLEDNLDFDSYAAMRRLAQTTLQGRAQTVRNACPGCFAGNNTDSEGDPVESHNPNDIGATPLAGFTLDGVSYAFPGESLGLSINAVKQLKTASIADGVQYFGLWRAQRQGLGDTSIAPQDRNYEVPTDAQKTVEMDLLRTGLTPVNTPVPTPADDQ